MKESGEASPLQSPAKRPDKPQPESDPLWVDFTGVRSGGFKQVGIREEDIDWG